MATSIREIGRMLASMDLRYEQRSDTEILTGFGGLQRYRNAGGSSTLTLVIQLSENGRYFTLFAPMAYKVPDHRAAIFLQACAMVQWKTKLIQFEYDGDDGEIRPVVEFPLEDSTLTPQQLMRCMRGMAQLIDQYHLVLERVLNEGVIEFEEIDAMEFFNRLLAGLEAAKTGRSRGKSETSTRDLSDIQFVSSDHIRYQDGRDVSGHNQGCKRGIQVECNINGGEGYTVTIHNLDGPHPVWGNNIQMAPKQMRVVREEASEVELRGFGRDSMGASFSDYGMTLHFDGEGIKKTVLHMHDRNVDIEYLKGEDTEQDDILPF